ncbi:MAG: histidinol-phosphatase HisJ family protein [Candidatus Thorarchaeota archaeon]
MTFSQADKKMKLGYEIMLDYHVHPNYSIDAEGSLEEFCRAALQKGLREIAFTTHLDSDPETDDCIVRVEGDLIDVRSSYWLEHYESSIRQMGDIYSEKGLEVRLGVEVDIYPGVEERLPDRFHSTDFDIIIGSVHLMDHLAISAKDRASEIFRKYSLQEMGKKYFTTLEDSITSSFFDIIGHLDLYRRFGEQHYGADIHELWIPYLDRIASKMKKHNVGFEINTSPLRRGQDKTMPERALVKALSERAISTVIVGSDAHIPKNIGAGVPEAIALLKSLGYHSITQFDHRIQRSIEID